MNSSSMPLQNNVGSNGLTVSSFRTFQNYPSPPPASTNRSASHSKHQSTFSMMNLDDADLNTESRLPMSSDPSGVYSILMTDSDMALTKRKFVKVSSIGELEVSPDRVEFCVQITSTKTDMAAARESIRKRDEFILLALKKLGVLQSGISSTSMVKRFKLEEEANDDDDILEAKILRDAEKQLSLSARKGNKRTSRSHSNNNVAAKDPLLDTERIKVIKELYVVCDNLNQYMELFSIINEKLDKQVNVSPPVIRITPENLQKQSQAAAKKAMDNAVLKATQILQSQKILKATVGKLFYSIEDSLTVTDIAEYHNIHASTAFETLKWKRNNKLVVCRLTSLFEVNTVKNRRTLE